MAISKTGGTYNRLNWEDAEFPILCQVCLGSNPYLRMIKEKFGKECKICARPFTIFRWCPGRDARYKKTEVCQTCAKLKNVCQTCLLDLEYGLPVQVRDHALQLKDEVPKNAVNRDYYIQNMETAMAADGSTIEPLTAASGAIAANEILGRLARTTPYYRRNLPHICSFWVKGECKRGEECPYRHEKPTDPDDPLADQNIRDRYYGVNDPVAAKLLKRAEGFPSLDPPEDKGVTTLYIGSLGDGKEISEKDLRDHFYQYGEIRAITMVPSRGCAFLQFVDRDGAEKAVEKTFSKLIIKGRRLTVRWGRPHGGLAGTSAGSDTLEGSLLHLNPVPGLPGALPMPPMMGVDPMDFFGLLGGEEDFPVKLGKRKLPDGESDEGTTAEGSSADKRNRRARPGFGEESDELPPVVPTEALTAGANQSTSFRPPITGAAGIGRLPFESARGAQPPPGARPPARMNGPRPPPRLPVPPPIPIHPFMPPPRMPHFMPPPPGMMPPRGVHPQLRGGPLRMGPPPLFGAPLVPRPPGSSLAAEKSESRAGPKQIHYPSQDPQRLGAKELQD